MKRIRSDDEYGYGYEHVSKISKMDRKRPIDFISHEPGAILEISGGPTKKTSSEMEEITRSIKGMKVGSNKILGALVRSARAARGKDGKKKKSRNRKLSPRKRKRRRSYVKK